MIDRDQVADLGLDLASVGRELGTLLGGGYVNRFNYFDRSYKVIPQIGDAGRATAGPLLDLKIKTPSGQLVPVSTFTHIESSIAPGPNRFQHATRCGFLRCWDQGGRTRVLKCRADASGRAGGTMPRVAADPARGIVATVTLGFAVILIYLVLAAQFLSFRSPDRTADRCRCHLRR